VKQISIWVNRSVRRASVVTVLLSVVLCACNPGAPELASSVLNRGLGQEPESVDPHRARTTQAHTVQRDLFEGLASYSADGRLVPGVAERWDVSAGGLQYTFYLRSNARWSNGEPLTASDFVYSFRRLVDPDTAAFYAQSLSAIENAPQIVAGELLPESLGVAATGEHILAIRLTRTTPYFLALLTHPSTFPVYAPSLEMYGDQFARPGNLVSNGAYALNEWVLGSVLTLTRNEHYWNDGATSIDVVHHHVAQEPASELYRYRAGELDITSTIPADAFADLRESRPDELRLAPALSVYFYGINLNHAELGDQPKLRQALSMAIDREALVEQVLGRGESPAWSFVPPGVDGYSGPAFSYAQQSIEERRERARELYAQAGYSALRPLEIELRYNTSATHRRIAVSIQEMWNDVLGFEVRLINEEFRVLVANMRAMEITQLFRLSWNGDYNDANSFLSLFRSDDPSNMFGYSNDNFDRLMAAASGATDPERRAGFLAAAERQVLDDHVVIPLYFPVSKHLVDGDILGWQDNVLDYHYSQHLSFAN